MTDQLTADVERWLAEQVRTTWPGKSGDCCDADERADMARWFADQIRAFETWRQRREVLARLQSSGLDRLAGIKALDTEPYLDWESDPTDDGEAAVCPVTASEPPNSTPTAQKTNRTPQSDVVNTLLEAAGAARTRTLPPPKPGTHARLHCTHWTTGGNEQCCDCGQVVPDNAMGHAWCLPTANRQENR